MWKSIILLIAVFAIASPSTGAAAESQVVPLDRIVAVVDDDVITRSELDSRMEMVVRQLQQQGTALPDRDILRRQILERLIVERIQLRLARQRGIRVDDESVNQVVARIAEENGMNLMQFHNVLERDGYDFADFRDNIRKEIIVNRLQSREVEGRINISPQEVDEFLEARERTGEAGIEYRLSHILISLPEAASPREVEAAKAKAEQVLAELKNGADFAKTAVAYSDGQQALEGGDLGWRHGGELPSFFAGEVIGLEEGAISGLIRSPNGYHILKLQERRGEQRHTVRQVHARHILIRTDELTSDDNARGRLERIRSRLVDGDGDFAELARAYSDDKGSTVKGGDLGWMNPAEFTPEFTEVVKDLEPGEFSQPFKSRFGWHLVQVLEWRSHDDTDEYLRARARQQLQQRKMDEEIQKWTRRLRDHAYIEVRLDS